MVLESSVTTAAVGNRPRLLELLLLLLIILLLMLLLLLINSTWIILVLCRCHPGVLIRIIRTKSHESESTL